MMHIVLGMDLSSQRDITAIACPACRARKRAGFMYCRMGCVLVPYDEAPREISWPLECTSCGYEDIGIPANPMPAPIINNAEAWRDL